MVVYWFEQTTADVPCETEWLSPAEALCLSGMRFARRRSDWLLGRWTAKRALSLCLEISCLRDIEILAEPSGAPEVRIGGQAAPARISLSHRAGVAVCAVTLFNAAIGCDLEKVEPHGDAFFADFFTPEEHSLVAQAPPRDQSRLITLLWSGKESALKALSCGLRIDTRQVVVIPQDANSRDAMWHRLEACYAGAHVFRGWWRHSDELLRSMVASPPPSPPVLLGV